MTAVTPTDRPKSVRNRYVIKVFGGVFYVVTLLFVFFFGCRGFFHRTESDLFIFLLHTYLLLILAFPFMQVSDYHSSLKVTFD